MSYAQSLTLADRIALTLDGLCRAVAARIAPGIAGWAMQAAVIVLVWTRVRRADTRIRALLARFQAGLLRVSPPRGAMQRGSRGGAATYGASRPALGLPRRFAWLLPMVPYEAAGCASLLRVQLADPEMIALLRASPQARRVLAPVCRMLGIEADMLQAPTLQDEMPDPVSTPRAASDGLEGRDDAGGRATRADVQLYRIWWDGD